MQPPPPRTTSKRPSRCRGDPAARHRPDRARSADAVVDRARASGGPSSRPGAAASTPSRHADWAPRRQRGPSSAADGHGGAAGSPRCRKPVRIRQRAILRVQLLRHRAGRRRRHVAGVLADRDQPITGLPTNSPARLPMRRWRSALRSRSSTSGSPRRSSGRHLEARFRLARVLAAQRSGRLGPRSVAACCGRSTCYRGRVLRLLPGHRRSATCSGGTIRLAQPAARFRSGDRLA